MNDSEAWPPEHFVDEMAEGDMDGRNPENPPPSGNRSASYRHGLDDGRKDAGRPPRATATMPRLMTDASIRDDSAKALGRMAAPLRDQ